MAIDIEAYRPDLGPETLTVIDNGWFFDKETYEGLGINFSPLEDPDQAALMPTLRRRAFNLALAIHQGQPDQIKNRAQGQFLEARSPVYAEIGKVNNGIREIRGNVDKDDPVILDFQERRIQRLLETAEKIEAEQPVRASDLRSRSTSPVDISRISLVDFIIARKRDEKLFEEDKKRRAKYVPGIGKDLGLLANALAYTTARTALHFDL